jgi:hypothetical protein
MLFPVFLFFRHAIAIAHLGPPRHGGPSSLPARFCFRPSIVAHLAHLRCRLLPSDARAATTRPAGVAAPCAAACHALLHARGAKPKSCLAAFLLPHINLAPRQLLSLLHSLKWSVLNFHRRRSIASSDPSPHRPDAIKGARSHGHFTRSVLPHLALLICAPSCPTPSTDTVFHSPPPPAQPRHRAAQFWPR